MRSLVSALVLSLAATASHAAQPVVTENLAGTISGSCTVDTKGLFGPAGADLSGSAVAIHVQYVPRLLGPSQACRNHSCTYNQSDRMPDTQGALLVTVTVNSQRVVYVPVAEAAVFFPTQAPYQLTIDADAYSGFGIGLRGIQFAALFTSAPAFGQPLSPANPAVQGASASDYVAFYDASSQTPVEQLTYTLTGSTK